ncbi:MAG: hypothetical protein WDN66_02180 [Candidatus Saccharibacteria bacterium]
MAFTVELGPVDREKHKAFERQISRDFYLSFKFAQGHSPIQPFIYRVLGNYYRSQPDYDPTYIRENSIELMDKLMRFTLPKSHVTKSSKGGDFNPKTSSDGSAFMSESGKFIEALNVEKDPHADIDLDIETITRGLIRRDRVYQANERGYQAADPHASYFRQYVLLREPTGSAAYDHIFARSLDLLAVDRYKDIHSTLPIAEVVSWLAPEWETNHPGESFLPADSSHPV